jgi:hypothetical protein
VIGVTSAVAVAAPAAASVMRQRATAQAFNTAPR